MSVVIENAALEKKREGVCGVKPEYILGDVVRQANENPRPNSTEKVKEENIEPLEKKYKNKWKKNKPRGQNKARGVPFKSARSSNLCLWLVDQAEDEPEKKCQNSKCEFMHDRTEFLKIKPEDIAENCYVFEKTGRCPQGASCRMGSKHLTPEGFNIIDKEKYEEFKKKPLAVKNQLEKSIQEKLRTFKYDFSKSEEVTQKIVPPKKGQNEVKLNYGKRQNGDQKETCPEPKQMKIEPNEENSETVSKTIENGKAIIVPKQEEKALVKDEPMENNGDQEETCPEPKQMKIEPNEENLETISKTIENGEAIIEIKQEKKALVKEEPMENSGKSLESVEAKEKPCGPILDTEEIKLRKSERKTIDWKNKLLLSPLTTVGNLPFRRICKEFGADVTCGEMALATQLLKGTREEWALVKRHESEDIFGVQICGNNAHVLSRCAQLLNQETEIDFVDLNVGCPIDLIYKQGSGCGLLNKTGVFESIVKCAVEVLDIPFTVKTRTGVYMDKPMVHHLMPKFRDFGVSMVNIHGRSREQRYTKLANWDYIEKCAQAATPLPVFGAGDILSYEDYKKIRENYTSISGVSIGRGALIKPWIFQEIKEQKLIDFSSRDRFDILKKYVNYGLEHWGSDTRGVETTRRFLLEWLSFLHRYIPVEILECPPQKMNARPPFYKGRDELETLMASSNCNDWIKISEMLLGKVPEGFNFLPKHKANSW